MVQVNQPVSADQPDWVCFERGRPHPGHAVRHPLGRAGPRAATAASSTTATRRRPSSADGAARCGIHRLGAVVSRGVLLDVARALGRRRARAGLPDHARRPRRGVRAGAASTSEPGDIVLVRTGQMVHLAPDRRDLVAYTWPSPGPDHRDGGVVPRPRRRRGGHRHAGLRGLPVPARGRLPPGAPAAPGRDGPDPGPELGARPAGRATAPPTAATPSCSTPPRCR